MPHCARVFVLCVWHIMSLRTVRTSLSISIFLTSSVRVVFFLLSSHVFCTLLCSLAWIDSKTELKFNLKANRNDCVYQLKPKKSHRLICNWLWYVKNMFNKSISWLFGTWCWKAAKKKRLAHNQLSLSLWCIEVRFAFL